MNIEDFADKTPTFVLEEFFSGDLRGWGTTLRRMGGLQNRFSIDAQGVWDPSANVLSLKEMYTFDDGHSDVLTWTIIKRDEGKYEGRETLIDGLRKGRRPATRFGGNISAKFRRPMVRRPSSASTTGFSFMTSAACRLTLPSTSSALRSLRSTRSTRE